MPANGLQYNFIYDIIENTPKYHKGSKPEKYCIGKDWQVYLITTQAGLKE